MKDFLKNYKPYIICISICVLAELSSSIITQSSVKTWYMTIIKPGFTPPNWVFAPVWTILYLMMGFTWGRINKIKDHQLLFKANFIFTTQLLINISWSFIYFGARQIGWAFIDIILLCLILILNIYYFYKIDKISGLLLIPYLLWVSYATILNGTIWYLNK